MENKDVYSTAGNEDTETKAVPGYVPAPIIRSDFPAQTRSEDGDATLTADDVESGTPAYANRDVDTVGRSEATADPETGTSGFEDSSQEPANESEDTGSKRTATKSTTAKSTGSTAKK